MPPPDRVFRPPTSAGHRGLLGPFMALHGLGDERDEPANSTPARQWTAAELSGLSPEDLRLATAEKGDPYLVGLEDDPPPSESPASQAHLDHLYEALGVAEEPWEREFWRTAEQQRGRASAVVDPAPARTPAAAQPDAVLDDVVLTAADDNRARPSRQSSPPPIPPARPRAPSIPDPGYFGATRPPDRLQAVRTRPPAPIGLTARDLDVVTRTALGEARGESDEGMGGVLSTIRNRMELKPDFYGSTPSAVALQHKVRHDGRVVYQYDANNPHPTKPSDNYYQVLAMLPGDEAYDRAREIARQVFDGLRADATDGAIGFRPMPLDPATGRPQAIPSSMGPNAEFTRYIGSHAFVKDPALQRRRFYPDEYPGYRRVAANSTRGD